MQFNVMGMRMLLVIVGFCMFMAGHAQVSQVGRFEVIQKQSDNDFLVISLKKEGLALLRDKNEYNGGNQVWELILLDTTLRKRNTVELEIKGRYHILGYEYVAGKLFLLYRAGESERGDIELVRFDLNDYRDERFAIKPDLNIQITQFTVVGNHPLIGGYVNKEPVVLLYVPEKEQVRILPGFFQKDMELVDVRFNQNPSFNVLLADRSTKENNKLTFRTYDQEGVMLLEEVYGFGDEKKLMTGLSSVLEREDMIVTGTWGDRNSRQSKGFYFIKIDPFQTHKIKYISYPQLEHFLDYLKPKQARRIREKALLDIQSGNETNYTNNVNPYRIVEHKDGYLILAEVYQQTGSKSSPYPNTPSYYSPYGVSPYASPFYYPTFGRYYQPYPYYPYGASRVPEEVNIYETLVMAVSPEGELLWDQSLKLEDVDLPSPEQIGDFFYRDNRVSLFYKQDSELVSKSVELDDGQVEEKKEKVLMTDPFDEVRSEDENQGGVRFWYGQAYYMWGYQTVRNLQREDRVREVFYVNKLNAR